eukprot:758101-Hanusia_phi.AAC.3
MFTAGFMCEHGYFPGNIYGSLVSRFVAMPDRLSRPGPQLRVVCGWASKTCRWDEEASKMRGEWMRADVSYRRYNTCPTRGFLPSLTDTPSSRRPRRSSELVDEVESGLRAHDLLYGRDSVAKSRHEDAFACNYLHQLGPRRRSMVLPMYSYMAKTMEARGP